MAKVVLDTNVFVSALLTRKSPPAQILDAWKRGLFTLVVSPVLVEEILRVLRYPKIRNKYQITEEDVEALLSLLKQEAFWVQGSAAVEGAIPEDPDDEHILATALEGEADVIVSGDEHLLQLHHFRHVPIMSPREFLAYLKDLRR